MTDTCTPRFEIMRADNTAKLQSFKTGKIWFAYNLATNMTQM